jgi:hypothetical protein
MASPYQSTSRNQICRNMSPFHGTLAVILLYNPGSHDPALEDHHCCRSNNNKHLIKYEGECLELQNTLKKSRPTSPETLPALITKYSKDKSYSTQQNPWIHDGRNIHILQNFITFYSYSLSLDRSTSTEQRKCMAYMYIVLCQCPPFPSLFYGFYHTLQFHSCMNARGF